MLLLVIKNSLGSRLGSSTLGHGSLVTLARLSSSPSLRSGSSSALALLARSSTLASSARLREFLTTTYARPFRFASLSGARRFATCAAVGAPLRGARICSPPSAGRGPRTWLRVRVLGPGSRLRALANFKVSLRSTLKFSGPRTRTRSQVPGGRSLRFGCSFRALRARCSPLRGSRLGTAFGGVVITRRLRRRVMGDFTTPPFLLPLATKKGVWEIYFRLRRKSFGFFEVK